MNTFMVSDVHFNHNKSFIYEPRGFQSVEEMNEAIIEQWNEVVTPNDVIYNLGDFAMCDVDESIDLINRLNCANIVWIRGNHDSENKVDKILKWCPKVQLITDDINCAWSTVVKYKKMHFYLSHYPTLTANYGDESPNYCMINLHGHTHSKEKFEDPTNPFRYNVALDAHNCYPVNIETITKDIWDRYNEVKNAKQESMD